MSDSHSATLALGLPVYNGEEFLGEALESILSQTCPDFQLIICDNASTDATESICRNFAERDSRVRYHRNARNIGAAGNWNRVFELASCEYFKWIAHDDLHRPEFLEKCLSLLRSDQNAVLAYSKAITIDDRGRHVRAWGASCDYSSPDPSARYFRWLAPAEDPLPLPIFGVIRADILRRTQLFVGYPESDIALLAELSLYGRFLEVPETLFLQREHQGRAGPKLASDRYAAGASFWNSDSGRRLYLPHWSLIGGLIKGLQQAPLSVRERTRCAQVLIGWARRNINYLGTDLGLVCTRIPLLGDLLVGMARFMRGARWRSRLRRCGRVVDSLVPGSATFILVDGDSFGGEVGAGRRVRPFLENESGYAGPPLDDQTAIDELERMRGEGSSHLIFGWPCFWWLTYYRGLIEHLDAHYSQVLRNDLLVVYDLRDSESAGHSD